MDRSERQKSLGDCFLPAPLNGGFSMEGYWVWCGSVIKGEDGRYHMFASRWPKALPFHPGWGMASEIVRAVSDTPEGPYTFAEVVLGARGAGWWDGRSTHNPSIHKVNDTYVLFYIGITNPFFDVPGERLTHYSSEWIAARATKRIGIATSKSVFGPWKRPDTPTIDVRAGYFDNFFVSNPAPCIKPDGSCLLVYKTRTYREPPYDKADGDMFSSMKLGVMSAPHYSGPYTRLTDVPLFDGDDATGGVLHPFIWYTKEGYAMIAKDWKGTYTGDTGSMVYAKSPDGVHWEIDSRPACSRNILWSDGVRRTMGNMDRPFLLFDNDEATHLFVATNDGSEAGFATMTRSWNACIPLK